MNSEELNKLQRSVNKLLNKGVFFSIFWLMGLGSLISITSAVKASRIMKANTGQISGKFRVWWCFIVGGAGVAIWIPILFIMVYHNI